MIKTILLTNLIIIAYSLNKNTKIIYGQELLLPKINSIGGDVIVTIVSHYGNDDTVPLTVQFMEISDMTDPINSATQLYS